MNAKHTLLGVAPPKSGSAPEPTRNLTPTGRYRLKPTSVETVRPLARLPHLNGFRYAEIEFEDQCFLRKLKAWGLARVVDRVVQIRQPSDVGYTIPYSEAVATARVFGFEVGS
jgi:hypothetical protein